MEDCPEKARGIISGMLQQGYAFGYLLATVFARALVDTTPHKWRPLYWFGAAVPVLIITFRLFLGETETYMERKRVRESGDGVGKTFMREGQVALKKHWMLLIYMVLLMAGFNFMSHGSQVSHVWPRILANLTAWSLTCDTICKTLTDHLHSPGPVPHYAHKPIQLHPECGDCDPSRGELGSYYRRHDHWLPIAKLRSSLQHHLHFDRRGSTTLSILFRPKRAYHGRCLLRAVLCARSVGSHPYPSNGIISRLTEGIRCRNLIPAGKLGIQCFEHHRSNDWRKIPTSAKDRGARQKSAEVSVWKR